MTVDDIDDPAARLLTTAESAQVAHVPETAIRDWACDHSKKEKGGRPPLLIPADRDPGGRPLYREIDVLEVERRTRRKARETRLATEAADSLAALSSLGT